MATAVLCPTVKKMAAHGKLRPIDLVLEVRAEAQRDGEAMGEANWARAKRRQRNRWRDGGAQRRREEEKGEMATGVSA